MNVVCELPLIAFLDEVVEMRYAVGGIFRANGFVAVKRTIDTSEVDGINVFRFIGMLDYKGGFGGQHRGDDRTRVAAL